MVGLDGICAGSLVASVSGFICFAQLEGQSLGSLHNIIHLRVNRIFGLSDGNFLCGLRWSGGFFVTDYRRFTTTGICGWELQLELSMERLWATYMLLSNPGGRRHRQSRIYRGHDFGVSRS